jgi:hypothetical protein
VDVYKMVKSTTEGYMSALGWRLWYKAVGSGNAIISDEYE